MRQRPRLWPILAAVQIIGVAALAVAGPTPAFAVAGAVAATDAIRVPRDAACYWQAVRWDDLNQAEQAALKSLGWSADSWSSKDPRDSPPSEFQAWDELSDQDRKTVAALGFTQATWDDPMCTPA